MMNSQRRSAPSKQEIAQQSRAPELGELDLNSGGGLLIKFTVNDKWFDQLQQSGLRFIKRKGETELDMKHQLAAAAKGDRELGVRGRIREGLVDTGENIFSPRLVHAGFLRRGLGLAGWRLTGAHWFKKEDEKYVLVLGYNKPKEPREIYNPGDEELQCMRALARLTWGQAHIWQNPTGVDTINFVACQGDRRPGTTLRVRKRSQIVAERIPEPIAEEAEGEE